MSKGSGRSWRRSGPVVPGGCSTSDAVRAGCFESCPTLCFLANPQIDRAAYQDLFHLTETQAERIATLIPRQQLLLRQPGISKVLNLHVDAESARLFSLVTPRGDHPLRGPVATSQLDVFGDVKEGAVA